MNKMKESRNVEETVKMFLITKVEINGLVFQANRVFVDSTGRFVIEHYDTHKQGFDVETINSLKIFKDDKIVFGYSTIII